MPFDAGVMRKAQAKQLKGFLLAFDQLLANSLAQLRHAKDLFSVESASAQTYFFQYLERSRERGTNAPNTGRPCGAGAGRR